MNATEFYLCDFHESILRVWAHKDFFFTTYGQTDTTRITARKFLTNVEGQLSYCRLVLRVLETKIVKGRRCARPQAYLCFYTASVGVKIKHPRQKVYPQILVVDYKNRWVHNIERKVNLLPRRRPPPSPSPARRRHLGRRPPTNRTHHHPYSLSAQKLFLVHNL